MKDHKNDDTSYEAERLETVGMSAEDVSCARLALAHIRARRKDGKKVTIESLWALREFAAEQGVQIPSDLFGFLVESASNSERLAKYEATAYPAVAAALSGVVDGGCNRADVYVGDVPVEVKTGKAAASHVRQLKGYMAMSGSLVGVLVTSGLGDVTLEDGMVHVTLKFDYDRHTWTLDSREVSDVTGVRY